MLDWLTTIPGILITCGVVLLIIALILLVLNSKKIKRENIVKSNTDAITSNVNSTSAIPVVNNEVTNDPIIPTIENVQPTVENIVSNEPVVTNTEVETIVEPEVFVSSVKEQVPVEETTAFDIPKMDTTTSEPTVSSQTTTVEAPVQEIVEEKVESTYGSSEPTTEEKPVTIYGGNDPLEKTQSLPKMEPVHHEPYGGVSPEVRTTETVQLTDNYSSVEQEVKSDYVESLPNDSTYEDTI